MYTVKAQYKDGSVQTIERGIKNYEEAEYCIAEHIIMMPSLSYYIEIEKGYDYDNLQASQKVI